MYKVKEKLEDFRSFIQDTYSLLSENKKYVFSILFTVFLIIATVFGMNLANQKKLVLFKSQAEELPVSAPNLSGQTQERFVKNEILFKLKTGSSGNTYSSIKAPGKDFSTQVVSYSNVDTKTIPDALKNIDKQYKVKTIEKVFKNAQSPEEDLKKIKQRLSIQINEQQFLQKDLSKTYKVTFEGDVDVKKVVEDLSKDPNIEYAEPNYTYYLDTDPNDPFFADKYPSNVSNRDTRWNPPHDYQWNIKATNSSNNWQTDTSRIVVAVIDTGVDMTHSELGGMWTNQKEATGSTGIDDDNNGCIDDIHGCNVTAFNPDGMVNDNDNHGTHVAGVISAKTNNNIGIAGITNNTKIMGVKVFWNNGYSKAEYVANGVRYAASNGARIMNMSLGGSFSTTIEQALDYATSLSVIPVVAAGNGNSYSPSYYPASYKKGITVGGVHEGLQKMNYSNYGPNIDVSAPGGGQTCGYFDKPGYCSNILSLKSTQNANDQDMIVAEKYLRMSGTSMATPHVAGVVALLLAKHPTWGLAEIENYIRFNSIDPQGKGHTEKMGWGIINSTGTNIVDPSNIDFDILYPAENSLVGQNFGIGGVIKADNFQKYTVSYRVPGNTSWITQGVQLTNGGNSPILPPVYSDILNPAATITLPSQAPKGVYEIKVELFLNNGKSLKATRFVNYLAKPGTTWLTTSQKPKPDMGEILVADLENDGLKEIIAYNTGSDWEHQGLSVFDHQYRLKWRVDQAGEVVIGNIDKRTPTKEVILQTETQILVFNNLGTQITDLTINYSGTSFDWCNLNLLTLDTNRNGIDELYFTHCSVGYRGAISSMGIHVYEQNQNNQLINKWNYNTLGSRLGFSWPLGADINGDGSKEIIVLNSGPKVEALNSNGQVIAQYTIPNVGSYNVDNMVAADMDLDGKEEIILHVQWGPTKLLKYSNNAFTEIWSVDNQQNAHALSVGDFNNDRYPEIYINLSSASEGNQILDRNGNLFFDDSTAPLYFSFTDSHSILLIDKNNNNFTEIICEGFKSVDYRSYLDIRELNNNNKQITYPEGEWKAIISTPDSFGKGYPIVIDDLESNGKLDLIIAGTGIIEYDTQGKIYWPHKYHDYQRTKSYNTPLDPFTSSCSGNYASGKSINWTASVTPNTGTISYSWTLGAITGQSGFGSSTIVSYSTCGAKTTSVIVTRNGVSQTVNCPTVTIPASDCTVPIPTPTPTQLTVQIRAWGKSYNGNPVIALLDGTSQQISPNFTVTATSSTTAQVFTYTFPSGKKFTQKPVIRFVNGASPMPTDKKVYIDYIRINNVTYQTEDSRTFSYGSWNSTQGCMGGAYAKTETLGCSGAYLRYDQYLP